MSQASERLKEEADILSVVQALGIETKRKGDSYFFHCPNPAHEDTHESCTAKPGWKNVFCFSCGYHAQAIDLIMDVTGDSFQSACDRLAEIEGNPDWYIKRSKAAPLQKKRFLSPEQERMFGVAGWKEYGLTEDDVKRIVLKKIKKIKKIKAKKEIV